MKNLKYAKVERIAQRFSYYPAHQQGRVCGHIICGVVYCPWIIRVPHLISFPTATVLKFLIIYELEALRFYFALSPTNYVSGSVPGVNNYQDFCYIFFISSTLIPPFFISLVFFPLNYFKANPEHHFTLL